MATAEQLRAIESAFSMGSEGRYRHPTVDNFVITEGLKTFIEVSHCYWLVHLLSSICTDEVRARQDKLPHGTLLNSTVKVVAKDGRMHAEQEFSYPVPEDDVVRHEAALLGHKMLPDGEWLFSLEWDGIIAFPKTVLVGLLLAEH